MNLKVNVTIVSAVLFVVLGYAHEHGSNCSHGHSHAETKMSRPGPFLENIHDVHDRDHDHKNAKCTANHQTVHPVKSVAVVKAVQQAMGLKTVRVERRRIDSTMTFAGRYELVPDARKVVSSPVAGRLSFIARTLDNVRKGDPLFTVTSPDLVARSREISLLEKRLKVYRELNTPNAALENELAVKCAEREAMLAGADENDGVVTVRAAEDGMVESLIARDGAWLDTGAEALQTVHVRHLRFKALAAVSDALQLKDGLSAKVGTNAGCIRVGVGDDTGIVPVYVLFDDYNRLHSKE